MGAITQIAWCDVTFNRIAALNADIFAPFAMIRQQAVLPRREKKPADPPLQKPSSQPTLRWREMDSNFQYASTERWHRATDLPLPPNVKRRSAGARLPWRDRAPRRRGSVRPAAMRSTHREMRRAAMRAAALNCRTAAVDGGYAMVAVWKSGLVGSDINPLHGVFGERATNRGWDPGFCGT